MNATLHHTVDEAANIRTYFFTPDRPLRYIAGQFIEMTLPHDHADDRGVKRWFTLSSAPGHELVSITTKHAPKSSSIKQALWELKPGDSLSISDPMGDFVLPKDESTPLVFVAGGIGITPYHAMVQWLHDTQQERNIHFIYSVSSPEEIIFEQLFNTNWIKTTQLIAQPKLTADQIAALTDGLKNKQVFLSGPEPMIEALVEQFKKLGLGQDQLITDYFPGYLIESI